MSCLRCSCAGGYGLAKLQIRQTTRLWAGAVAGKRAGQAARFKVERVAGAASAAGEAQAAAGELLCQREARAVAEPQPCQGAPQAGPAPRATASLGIGRSTMGPAPL